MRDRFGIDTLRQGTPFWKRPETTRRLFFRHAGVGLGYFGLASLDHERMGLAQTTAKVKQVIFVMLRGGASHVDTFDLKVGAWTPANLTPADYGSIKWPRGLMPRMAEHLEQTVLVRSVRSWALVHGLAQVWMQIGRNPTAGSARIAPHIGSVVSYELAKPGESTVMPAFICLNVGSGIGNGFLSPENAPYFTTPGGGGLANSRHNDGQARFDRRYGLLLDMDAELRKDALLGGAPYESQAYNTAARRLVYNPKVDEIFTFDAAERTRYGTSNFGNSCIAARNMIRAKSGTRFIQIMHGDWDHHDDIWAPNAGHYRAAKQMDDGLGALMDDLKKDGSFDETLILAMGEFGRTVGALTPTRGRDHLLQQAVLFAGGGIRGGRVIGASNTAGNATQEPGWSGNRDIRPEDIEATLYQALGIDWSKTIAEPSGRRFEYVPKDRFEYRPIDELWG